MNRQDLVTGQAKEISPDMALEALNNRWALAASSDFGNDVDVLNYALTLEYLEATFYQQGNKKGLLTDSQEKAYLASVQKDEETHVAAITATIKKLGGTPVAAPKVDFGKAFDSRASFLGNSFTFENVGVGAYLGAAGFIKNKSVLQAAAGIFSVEARHAAIVANLLGKPVKGGVFMGNTETPKSKSEVLKDVAPFLVKTPSPVIPKGAPNTGAGGTSDSGVNVAAIATGGVLLAGAGAALVARQRVASNGDSES